MQGLIGRKLGMTQVFDENGTQVPVTVLQAGPCVVVDCKTSKRDGYDAVQLGFSDQKEQRLSKPLQGHFKKAGVGPKHILREFAADKDEEIEVGNEVNVTIFEDTPYVDVTAVTKGRGFQGPVKRFNVRGGRATHGSSNHRRLGSVGQCETPSRIFKNRKMPGQMGNVRQTTQSLKVVRVLPEDNVLLVRGAVPGPSGGIVLLNKALRKKASAS